MVKFNKKSGLLLVILMLVLIYPVITNAEMTQEMLAEGEPAYMMKEARSLLKEIVPVVEQAVGRKFIKTPRLKLVNREKIAAVLRLESRPRLANLYPNYSDEQLDALCSTHAKLFSVALMGKYGINDGVLYLLPRNLIPIMKLAKVDEQYAQSLLKLIIAHELVHSLQDQETELQRIDKITGVDELNAFTATIEGHAVFIQEKVGLEMGLGESVIEMSRLLSAGAVKNDDPAKEIANKVIASQFEQIYLGGKRFIEYHYNQGGNERVWEIVAAPPVKTAMISRPDTYSPVKQGDIDYKSLLDGLEQDLGGNDWQVQNFELGEMMIRSAYAKMDERVREEIISQIEHIQSFIAQKADPPCIVNLSVFIIKDGDFSKKYLTALEELAQLSVKEIESSPSMGVKDFFLSDFTGIKADLARKGMFTVFMKNKTGEAKQTLFRICRDNVILEVLISNLELDDAVVVKLAEKVFARYEILK